MNDIDREELCGNFLCTGGEFELEIEVSDETDASATTYTATQTLTVSISDINDNKPICRPSELSVDWAEGATGVTGFMLPCGDKDEGDTLTASILSANENEALTMFSFTTGKHNNLSSQLHFLK